MRQNIYTGSCHCGRVSFRLRAEIGTVIECNCSLCSKKGALWHGSDDAHFEILSGADDLVPYQFGTMTAKHYFCRQCGVNPFSHPRIAPAAWAVNVRCLDGVDVSSLNIVAFDGRNWEHAAQQFMLNRARGAV